MATMESPSLISPLERNKSDVLSGKQPLHPMEPGRIYRQLELSTPWAAEAIARYYRGEHQELVIIRDETPAGLLLNELEALRTIDPSSVAVYVARGSGGFEEAAIYVAEDRPQ